MAEKDGRILAFADEAWRDFGKYRWEYDVASPTRLTLLDEIRSTHSSDRWSEFFARYGDLLASWLVANQVSAADADDLKQETMLAVMRDLPNFEHNGRAGAFRSWLKTILRNRIRRLWEKRNRRPEANNLDEVAAALADDSTSLSRGFDREHEAFLVKQLMAMAKLRFDDQRVEMFRELVIDGQSMDYLTQKYHLNSGTIRVQQHRIMKWFRTAARGLLDI